MGALGQAQEIVERTIPAPSELSSMRDPGELAPASALDVPSEPDSEPEAPDAKYMPKETPKPEAPSPEPAARRADDPEDSNG